MRAYVSVVTAFVGVVTAFALLVLVSNSSRAQPAKTTKAKMPLGFSLMPPDMDLSPPAKKVQCEKDMLTFAPDPVPFDGEVSIPYEDEDGNKLQWQLRPGVLLSECGFVHTLNIAIEHKQLKIEIDSLHTMLSIRSQGWEKAEVEYQKTIVALQEDLRKANTPSFWEENDGTIAFTVGIILGVAAGVALVFGAAEIVKALQNQQVIVAQ